MAGGCPVCTRAEFSILGKPKTNPISGNFISKDYKVVSCNNCRAYYVYPDIDFTDEQWGELYGAEYFSVQSKLLIRRREIELKKRFDRAEAYLGSRNRIRFLDIGAGEGKTLIAGGGRGWEVTGIDIADNRIEEAKSGKYKFIKAKFLGYQFPENHFDFIYLDSVLEHVLNPVEYMEKIRRILSPGGILYIGVPNEDSLFNDIRKIIFRLAGRRGISEKIKPFDSPYHVIGFNRGSLKYIINKTNFRIRYLRNFGRKFEFLSSPPTHRSFWISLFFLFPVEVIGYLSGRDVYFEAFLTKD